MIWRWMAIGALTMCACVALTGSTSIEVFGAAIMLDAALSLATHGLP